MCTFKTYYIEYDKSKKNKDRPVITDQVFARWNAPAAAFDSLRLDGFKISVFLVGSSAK